MQLSKDNRATTSCSECQRRKQRCSREWPCNHCQARKVAHLCQFTVRKLQQESPPDSAREPSNEARGRKRSLPGSPNATLALSDPDAGDSEDGLRMWGYMPGHVHFKVGPAEDNSPRKDSPAETVISDAVEKILHAIPPRSITDAFVNHFLGVVNYRYSAIYGPTLTDQYVQWWADRAAGKRLSPEFTCLLLRICAYSVQYLTPALRKMIEFELACDSQALTDRFAAAAEQLSQSFEASNTTIERVQEQFLKGAWLKSESKIVESWHALGCTIREAQELGIDKDAGIEGLSEFDIEIRRRIWTLLYIWDWQMSAWLGRPNLIDQKNLTFKFPNLRLDQSSTEPNLLSPFAHMALQANLGRRVATVLGDAQSTEGLSAKQVLSVEKEIEKFVEELPPIFKVKNPDRSLDEQHPYFVFQRHQLHCVIFVTMLDFLKPFLTRDRHDKLTENDDEFRKMGIDISLQLLRVARDLFDHEFPINAKFHMVVFSIFDTATLLCSAIIHDRDHVLPQRTEVMDALESSLEMLHQLSLTTKLGAASYRFLHNLVQATPELARHSTKHKRQRKDISRVSNPSFPSGGVPLPQMAQVDQAPGVIPATMDPLPSLTSSADDVVFDVENFLAHNPFGEFGNPNHLDMGGMEHIWDWENLHLDGFSQTDPTG
ncbi:hypothetical protein FB567DRAFT_4171 [Paraphoma chrysanthemicola]|uniref:Zn(2)-C6 fungal-type domain-containing protein n=1 Tax=Paraphoma chrysanthemicola TaxID=798071 RepID=A0A8K0RGC8_9PLEO|nr:hypothetical protein FB567DRAFT_4171 [Paraphoma chrysanthemicola]